MARHRYTFDRVVRLLIGALTVAGLLALVAYLSAVLVPFVVAFLCAYLLQPVVVFTERRLVKNRFAAIGLTLSGVALVLVAAVILLVPPIVKQGRHLAHLVGELVQNKKLVERARQILPADWVEAGNEFLRSPQVAPYLQPPFADAAPFPAPHEMPPALALTDAQIAAGAAEGGAVAEEHHADWWQATKNFFDRQEIAELLPSKEKIMATAREALRNLLPFTANLFGGIFSGLLGLVVSIAGLVMMVLYLVYILRDYERICQGWRDLIPPERSAKVLTFIRDFETNMRNYFRAQVLIAAFNGVMLAVGFQLINLPMGLALGLFCGALSIVPYLQAVGFLPAAALALIYSLDTGVSFWLIALEIAAVFIAAQIIYDLVLVPKIMGDATKLSPAVILLSLSVWGKLLGLLGFLIALPMTCLFLAYYQRLVIHANDDESELTMSSEGIRD
ncbi:MAG: AI-2E family transporter [Planctomycetota bacterium]|nr:AI-2E family transporter [Planctomycetota bacterium]